MAGKAAFFAPLISTRPLRLLPPVIRILSIFPISPEGLSPDQAARNSLQIVDRHFKKESCLFEKMRNPSGLALTHFHLGNRELLLETIDQPLALNPNSPYIVGVAGWHMSLYGEWERGLQLLAHGMELNPCHPTWFHLVPFMNRYRLGEYELAHAEAQKDGDGIHQRSFDGVAEAVDNATFLGQIAQHEHTDERRRGGQQKQTDTKH